MDRCRRGHPGRTSLINPGLQHPICALHGRFQMPVLREGELSVNYLDDGAGSAVALVYSSVSGNKQ